MSDMYLSLLPAFLTPAPLLPSKPHSHSHSHSHSMPGRLITPHANATTQRLTRLRQHLKHLNLPSLLIPSSDAHNSETPPPPHRRRAYISNFTGSAGTALVTQSAAYLWTDGRYFLQAQQELDQNWHLMKSGLPGVPSIKDVLAGGAVAIDPFLHTVQAVDDLEDVVCTDGNLVDFVWEDRPRMEGGNVWLHGHAGRSVGEKLEAVRDALRDADVQYMLLCMLDDVCWLYNIRGDDIPHCPVVVSYALVGLHSAFLYVDPSKVAGEVADALAGDAVEIRQYDHIVDHLEQLEGRVWYDPATTSAALGNVLGERGLKETTPVQLQKACKNPVEIQGMKEAHLKDAVALSSFLCWLEHLVKGGGEISEVDAARKLREFRAAQDGFLMTSFATIPGSGSNGAIIHYHPDENSCAMVTGKEVFLLDSGGQYDEGTTDVTRTMHLGGCATDHEKDCFTRVLQGHIAIDRAVFPENTTGFMLDTLARTPLWSMGLDYRHGTGHGVGACLNVHEGPQSISPRISSNKVPLKEGMVVSNEPGYYEEGKFGIRIENLLSVVRKDTEFEFDGMQYFGFERLTYVPMDKGMINTDLMSKVEVEWLDEYHQQVWQRLSPRVTDGRVREWLFEKTRPLGAKAA